MKPIMKIIPMLLLLSFSAAGCGEKEPVEETQKKVSYCLLYTSDAADD